MCRTSRKHTSKEHTSEEEISKGQTSRTMTSRIMASEGNNERVNLHSLLSEYQLRISDEAERYRSEEAEYLEEYEQIL